VRRIAIDVAAKVGGEDLEPVLELARTDPEEIIRRAAARSLAN
jgi:HEAT repeat protein